MEQALSYVSSLFLSLYGIAALVVVGIGIYWLFNKKAKQKQLAELRAKLEQMKPSDSEYNAVRALYTSMMIDAHRWESFHGSDTAITGSGHHSGSGSHSSGGHSGGGGDGD
jgi:uncharacterized membrane protein YgcG